MVYDGGKNITIKNRLPIDLPPDCLTQTQELNANNQPIYIGEAEPGTLKSESGWRIRKMTYSGYSMTDIQWANGDAKFDKTWDDRASYSYS